MNGIVKFGEIKEFINKINWSTSTKYSDFYLYNYDSISHAGYDNLPAYRQNFFEINIEITNGCSFKVDQFEIPSSENRLTLISPHRLQEVKSDHTSTTPGIYKGFGIFFDPEFIGLQTTTYNFLKDYPFFSHSNFPSITFSQEEMLVIVDLVYKIQYEYANNDTYAREIIKNYLNILFLKASQKYTTNKTGAAFHSREQEIFHQFELLVQKRFQELSGVGAYADQLNISSKHLSQTVKTVSGKSALQLIHQAQLNHAKLQLQQTGKAVAEIAYELNFENPDYFSAFFKRLTGKTPTQFRIS